MTGPTYRPDGLAPIAIPMATDTKNRLFNGDNLEVLRRYS